MGERILEVERVSNEEVVLRLKIKRLRLLPDPTREHVRIARKELLLALRSLVDAAIEYPEQKETKKKRTKIDVK